MADSYRMTRAAYLQSLEEFRLFLKQHCLGLPGMTPALLYDLQLAVDEACTNIIVHGYQGMDPGSIIIDLDIAPGIVTVSLTDFGHSFEPDSAPVPDVSAPMEDRQPGGFGIYFIRQSVDRMDYRVTEDGNTMTLTKNLPVMSGGK